MDATADLRAVQRTWLENRLPDPGRFIYSQINDLVRQVADKTLEYSLQVSEGEDAFCMRLADACEIVDGVKYALTPFLADTDRAYNNRKFTDDEWERKKQASARLVWARRDLEQAFSEPLYSEENRGIDRQGLCAEIAKYLERPWMENRTIEWICVDALIFDETRQFGISIKENFPGRRDFLGVNRAYAETGGDLKKMMSRQLTDTFVALGFKLALLVALPIGAIWWGWVNGYEREAFYGGLAYCAVVLLKAAHGFVRFVAKQFVGSKPTPTEKMLALRKEMADVYRLLVGPVINPTLLKSALMKTRDDGAVWDGAVFALVDRIVARDPAAWTISQRYSYRTS